MPTHVQDWTSGFSSAKSSGQTFSGGTLISNAGTESRSPNPSASGPVETGGRGASRLAISSLEIEAEQLLSKGVAASTGKVYATSQRLFQDFCHRLSLTPLPASESTLILFVTELAQTRAHSTIRTYLAGARHLHVTRGLGNPLTNTLKLDLVLRGIHRVQPNKKIPRLLVTPVILARIKQGLDANPSFESTMLWAACCLGFLGFLRCGEFMLQSASQFDPAVHLTPLDIAVDSPASPSLLAVTIKRSKTD